MVLKIVLNDQLRMSFGWSNSNHYWSSPLDKSQHLILHIYGDSRLQKWERFLSKQFLSDFFRNKDIFQSKVFFQREDFFWSEDFFEAKIFFQSKDFEVIHYLKDKVGVVDFANAQGLVMFSSPRAQRTRGLWNFTNSRAFVKSTTPTLSLR